MTTPESGAGDVKPSCRSMYDPMRHVLVRHPSSAYRSQDDLDRNWTRFGYTSAPDFVRACHEFDVFTACLEEAGSTVHVLRDECNAGPDAIYVHDAALTLGSSFLLGRMGKPEREGEPELYRTICSDRGWPILGEIEAPGLLEGGDVVWLDERTLAVGVGYRTNLAGLTQLRQIAGDEVDEIIPVPLPHFRGPESVLHLMSLLSPIGPGLMVLFRPLLPVPFLDGLEASGFTLIDVPQEEFDTLGVNVLAATPSLAIMADGNPVTRRRIEAAGVRVLTYPGGEISLKGQGGPTCLTRPLVREPAAPAW